MTYFIRYIEQKISHSLARGKSVLLLGPRQTGKTTLIKSQFDTATYYNFAIPGLRRQFEMDPDRLVQEIRALQSQEAIFHQRSISQDEKTEKSGPENTIPIIILDEVQKVPAMMDVAQYCIDEGLAQFILTGSSARKLRRKDNINLLPGRVVELHLDALTLLELPEPYPDIKDLLLYGSLPEIVTTPAVEDKEEDLNAYVNTYLEEEIRAEAIVRNLGSFSSFLKYAAIEMNSTINFSKISQEIGITRNTLMSYFEILEDCLIANRIEPIVTTSTRRKLSKAPKYLFFDLGIRRICAGEGTRMSDKLFGHYFEQFVGIELMRYLRLSASRFELKYWQDHSGPEVDFVIDLNQSYIPIEVKWTASPNIHDCRHLQKFLSEYHCEAMAYIVCRTPRAMQITDRIRAIPWQELPIIKDQLEKLK